MLDHPNPPDPSAAEPTTAPPAAAETILAIATDADGIVNRSHASTLLPDGFIAVSAEVFAQAQAGFGRLRWVDGALEPFEPPPDPAMQPSLSDVQFFHQLALDGVISEGEALAAVASGAIPPALGEAFAHLPEAERFGAEIRLAGLTSFARLDPTIGRIQAALGWPDQTLNAFWDDAKRL